MSRSYDFLVIGAGISGAAAAFELAAEGRVLVLEGEAAPGYHSTGRSAALYTRNYGNAVVRRLNAASHSFFSNPPAGFADGPLLTPRGFLAVSQAGGEEKLQQMLALSSPGNVIHDISVSAALELAPVLREDGLVAALYEPDVMDMDVHAIHQGFLRGLKARGGELVCKARVTALQRSDGLWHARTDAGDFRAQVIVNAAGAWAEAVGRLAGASVIGLVPKRRTAILVDPPGGIPIDGMPATEVAGEEAYMKPDAGRIMASPGDATPTEPQDAQPEELDVAIVADWIERNTKIQVRRISHSWAGLRSFVADDAPVVGLDPDAPDFFWLAAQGGYGIMMAPTLGRATASLLRRDALPDDLVEAGLKEMQISPRRLRGSDDGRRPR